MTTYEVTGPSGRWSGPAPLAEALRDAETLTRTQGRAGIVDEKGNGLPTGCYHVGGGIVIGWAAPSGKARLERDEVPADTPVGECSERLAALDEWDSDD